MKEKYVLFDFDGVIVDSFRPAFEVNKLQCPHITEDEYRERFEGNINEWKETDDVHTPECRTDIDFFAEYIPRFRQEAVIIPGITDVVAQLAEQFRLIVISSTITSAIQEFLSDNKLSEYFEEVMGNDIHTSKVEKIKLVFSKYGAEPKDCVFITDTLGDIREAANLNVGSIAVTWGFHAADRLTKGNPFRIIETTTELPQAVFDYFSYIAAEASRKTASIV